MPLMQWTYKKLERAVIQKKWLINIEKLEFYLNNYFPTVHTSGSNTDTLLERFIEQEM